MKEKKFNYSKRFLSKQAKESLFHAFSQAKKNKTDLVTLKFVFYGLIKAEPSLLTMLINRLNKKNIRFSKYTKTLIYRCERSFKNSTIEDNLTGTFSKVTLSKSVRTLLYSSLRTMKNNTSFKYKMKDCLIITTLSLFIDLLKNKSIKNWLLKEIFLIKK